jgi:hypothetical protein
MTGAVTELEDVLLGVTVEPKTNDTNKEIKMQVFMVFSLVI